MPERQHINFNPYTMNKIAIIGNYPPRQCGIATFTKDLNEGFRENGITTAVIAMNDGLHRYDYPGDVVCEIEQNVMASYISAAEYLNSNNFDAVIVQHEFGIYGGQDGIHIIQLLKRLRIPVITTLHTILDDPTENQRRVVNELANISQKLVCISRKGIELLWTIYGIPPSRCVHIHHGVHQYDTKDVISLRKKLGIENKMVLLTFGLLSRNKSIEVVINALPEVVKKHPNTVYIVLGATHPHVVKHEGEDYRLMLIRLVNKLQLEKNVIFINRFVTNDELFSYLELCDIYVIPYLGEKQISSGTLIYTMGAAKPIISTPFWYAREMLADERGLLFGFRDSAQLSEKINDLLSDEEKRKTIAQNAFTLAKECYWPMISQQYYDLVDRMIVEDNIRALSEPAPVIESKFVLPPIKMDHLRVLTDYTGILQHAKFNVPDRNHGYCTDDNARALLMVLMAYRQMKDTRALELSPVYLSYIHYLQNADGTFRNFLSFNRNFLDEVGSEDSFGRTIWALGYLLGNAPNDAYYQTGRLVFFNAAPNFEKLKSIRGIANTMIGISYYLRSNPSDDSMTERLRNMAFRLVKHYEENESENWKWFESLLAYDNGILPLALLHSAEILNDDQITKTALHAMDFLTSHTLKDNYLSIIGNEKWYKKEGERSVFAQQPIDAMAMVLMYHQAFHLTRDKEYLNKLYISFLWFLGENDLRMSLYDFETKGCCDGFENYGVNRNQGAESSLAYLISHLTVLQAYEEFHELN